MKKERKKEMQKRVKRKKEMKRVDFYIVWYIGRKEKKKRKNNFCCLFVWVKLKSEKR